MSFWSQAQSMAAAASPDRNRYADFLRAISIVFVIVGHWLVATAYYDSVTGEITPHGLLDVQPETQWLSWLFQVMPVFFMVGGYANAISIQSSQARKTGYAQWLYSRICRLMTPLLVLIMVWFVLAVAMRWFGAHEATVQYVSQVALVPTWFLAIYTMIVMLAPWSYKIWRRYGYTSLVFFIFLSVLSDVLFFVLGWHWVGWTNYLWIWLAIHHIGYAWKDKRLPNSAWLLVLAVLGWFGLYAAVSYGPYPIAMAGSPGEDISNTLPPKSVLILLAMAQLSLLLAIEKPMRQLLSNSNFWELTVLMNSMIMSMYLWHMTVLVIIIGLMYLTSGFGLTQLPGSHDWWLMRPIWMLGLWVVLLPVALLFSPLERLRLASHHAPGTARLLVGAIGMGVGIALIALFGVSGEIFSLLNVLALFCLFAGAILGKVILVNATDK